MYIVAIAWLYIVGTASMTAQTFAGGLTVFVVIGLLPVVLAAWLDAMRRRSRRPSK